MMPLEGWSAPDTVVAVDACLRGLGGVFLEQYFHRKFPQSILGREMHINHLKMLTLMVAVKRWGV